MPPESCHFSYFVFERNDIRKGKYILWPIKYMS